MEAYEDSCVRLLLLSIAIMYVIRLQPSITRRTSPDPAAREYNLFHLSVSYMSRFRLLRTLTVLVRNGVATLRLLFSETSLFIGDFRTRGRKSASFSKLCPGLDCLQRSVLTHRSDKVFSKVFIASCIMAGTFMRTIPQVANDLESTSPIVRWITNNTDDLLSLAIGFSMFAARIGALCESHPSTL